jgi:CheY-like chemotaxis protein
MTRKFGGTGLGLSICRQFVELMGGKIWVESEVKKGSQFHFVVKLGLDQSAEKQKESEEHVNFSDSPILVVEDNGTTRQILTKMLTGWHLKTVITENAEEALTLIERAEREGDSFPLFLIDAYLPGMQSFIIQDHMRHNPDMAKATIMMLASPNHKGDAAPWQKLGVSAFITKPVKNSHLLDAVRSVISKPDKKKSPAPASQPKAQQESSSPPPESTTSPPRSEKAIQEKKETPEESAHSYRVLIAEDNIVNQKVAYFMLEKQEHQVTGVRDGKEALDALEKGIFDVILMDIQMPNMNGFEATSAIREKEKQTGEHIPIIAMTAHAMKGDRETCLEAGMDDYVSKPLKSDVLLSKIQATVQKFPRLQK